MGRVTPENIDKWLFDWKEGNLSPSQKEELNAFLINNPEFQADKSAWSSAFVNPMPKASYPNKSSLIKKRKPVYPYVAAAASLLLLIGTTVTFYVSKSNSDLEFNQLEGLLNQISLENNFSLNDTRTLSELVDKSSNSVSGTYQVSGSTNIDNNATYLASNNTTVGSNTNHQATSHTTTITEVASSSDVTLYEFMSEDFYQNQKRDLQIIDDELAEMGSDLTLIEETDESFSDNTMASMESLQFKTSKFKKFMNRFKNAMASGSGLVNLKQTDLAIAGYNHLDFNPAFAGNEFNTRVQTQGHARWIKDDNQLISMNVSADGYIHQMKGAIGIKASYSNFSRGMYQDANVALYYSPKIQVNKWLSIDPAVKFTIGNRWMNETRVNPGNEIELNRGSLIKTFEQSEVPNGTKVWYKDLGVGLNINTKWFYAAVSMDNILRHRTGVFSNDIGERAEYNFNAVLGSNYQSYNKKWMVSPFIAYSKNADNHEMWFGTGAKYNWLTFGAGVSTNADVTANIGFRKGFFQMYYQYELTKSNLSGARLNAHQVTFRINTKPNRAASKVVIF